MEMSTIAVIHILAEALSMAKPVRRYSHKKELLPLAAFFAGRKAIA